MGRLCDAKVSFYKMERVEADGRYWVRGTTNIPPGLTDYFACMTQEFAAHPFLDWVRAQKREAQEAPTGIGTTSGSATPTPAGPITVPMWQVGDEWQYAYKGASESGTYAVIVNRLEMLDGVNHYVVKAGTRESLYRVSDLAISAERLDGVVVSRDTPPRLRYDWPLTVGKSRAVKITWRNKNTNAVIAETWYAPDVKQWIKVREFLRAGIRERELFAFKLK
jgi:hypothetical protein